MGLLWRLLCASPINIFLNKIICMSPDMHECLGHMITRFCDRWWTFYSTWPGNEMSYFSHHTVRRSYNTHLAFAGISQHLLIFIPRGALKAVEQAAVCNLACSYMYISYMTSSVSVTSLRTQLSLGHIFHFYSCKWQKACPTFGNDLLSQ